MTKLFHLKSDHEREHIGDVVVNLDKVLTIKVAKKNDDFILAVDYTHKDGAAAWFKDRDKCMATLKDLITAMGGDPAIADDFVIQNHDHHCERKAEVLDALLSLKKTLEKTG